MLHKHLSHWSSKRAARYQMRLSSTNMDKPHYAITQWARQRQVSWRSSGHKWQADLLAETDESFPCGSVSSTHSKSRDYQQISCSEALIWMAWVSVIFRENGKFSDSLVACDCVLCPQSLLLLYMDFGLLLLALSPTAIASSNSCLTLSVSFGLTWHLLQLSQYNEIHQARACELLYTWSLFDCSFWNNGTHTVTLYIVRSVILWVILQPATIRFYNSISIVRSLLLAVESFEIESSLFV